MKASFIFIVVALAALTQQSTACSESTFRKAVAAAPKNIVSLKCQRAVYDTICDTCGKNVGCYWNMGPKVAPTLSQCQHRRSLRNVGKCSEAGFKKAIALAPKTGASLGCQRAVYNALCEECGTSMSCFFEKGPAVAKASPLCRPREITKFDLEDEEEEVRGRNLRNWGRICATAACLFIDGLNPPPARYQPGNNGPAPIHRPYDMQYEDKLVLRRPPLMVNRQPGGRHNGNIMDMQEEMMINNIGHYKLPHSYHDPNGWPGHDMSEY